MDTGFLASSLASAGADVAAVGQQTFAAVVQALEAHGRQAQGPQLALGQLWEHVLRRTEQPEVGERGGSAGWETGEWWEGLMA